MLSALRHRDFRLFWAAELVSRIGFWLQTVAQSWLVWHLSRSALAVGLVTASQLLPSLFLAPLGGLLADRLPRRKLLLATQVMLSVPPLVLWRLASLPHPEIALFCLAAGVSGVLSAVDTPTRLALIPGLVPRDVVANAVAIDTASVNLARVLGPALAAAVISAASVSTCFLLNALSYAAVVAVLTSLRVVSPPASSSNRAKWLEALSEGFRFARQSRDVREALLIFAVYAVLTMNSSTLLPAFADRVLHAGSTGLGLMLAAQGSGALIGTFVGGRLRFKIAVGRTFLAPALVASTFLIAFSATTWMWLAMACMVVVGLAQSRLVIAVQRVLQAAAPEHLRGRVMALFTQIMLGGLPLGALLAGVLARIAGAPVTIAGEASVAAIFAGTLVAAQALPRLLFRSKMQAAAQRTR